MIQSAEEFVLLRTSDDPAAYHRAAHDTAPEDIWHTILNDYPEMRQWVAHNKTVPLSILERLAYDSAVEVRTMVAMKRKLPEYLQHVLAQDVDSGVRFQVARNAKVQPSTLAILICDPELFIREHAAQRLAQI